MKLKVCGSRDPENIMQVAALKPEFIGFIFYSGSERYVGDDFVMPFVSAEIKKVGVFVDASATYIIDTINRHGLDLIQLHGSEKPEFCEVLNHLIPVIKAFGINEAFDFSSLQAYKGSCSYFLFDTKTEKHGGSGRTFDWNLLNAYDLEVPFFLSGGIGLIEATEISSYPFQAHCLDVNSKFEIEPGLKDIEKLKKLKNELSS